MPSKKVRGQGLRGTVSNIPVIGYASRIVWRFLNMPNDQAFNRTQIVLLNDKVDNQHAETWAKVDRINKELAALNKTIADNSSAQATIAETLSDIKHQLLVKSSAAQPKPAAVKSAELMADDHALDKFYIDFENKFRGPESIIKERLLAYLPYFKKLQADYEKYPVLDIGCGRGELLQMLKENGIRAIGIDLNESMVKRAKEQGYEALQADAVSYLLKQKTNSLSAITGFHIAEHIPFGTLVRILDESYRVLRPGGFIIFETPNPESLHVGSYSFYYDPSHLHPLPPDVLEFTAANRGFNKVEILRLHPKREDYAPADQQHDEFTAEVMQRFFGPQDYSVIGYKRSGDA